MKVKFFFGNFFFILFICFVYIDIIVKIFCSKCIIVGYLLMGIVEIVKQLVLKVINGVLYIMKIE